MSQEQGICELTESDVDVARIGGEADRMVADCRATTNVVKASSHLYGVSELRHITPHQLPGAQLASDGECLIERPGIRTYASVEIVHTQIIDEPHVLPTAERFDEQ